MNNTYRHTVHACFLGYIVQAIVNNYAPLLFLTFRETFGIPLEKITLLTTINFGLQLIIDLVSAGVVDRIGYRVCAVIAHLSAAVGFLLLAFLPYVFPDPFCGILISVMFYATGGGLLEVLISPIMEACPTDNKEKAMSLLHSFYCWGHVAVVLVSTVFFTLFGIRNWRILAMLWALVPLYNAFTFARVPLAPIVPDGVEGLSISRLLSMPVFWLMILFMVCSGASEQAVSQWASAFAEAGLGISKTMGDLAGPLFFASLMGLSRLLYGQYGDRIDLRRFMAGSCMLCVFAYLLIVFAPWPWLSLVGCGLCGLSVGIMWPGTFSLSSQALRGGGTAMFAFLALAGDMGCSSGPTLVGLVSAAFSNNLKTGILAAILFPLLMLLLLPLLRRLQPSGTTRSVDDPV